MTATMNFHKRDINFSDIDECTNSPCSVHASCMNNIGSYSCACHVGFTMVGNICQGIIFVLF